MHLRKTFGILATMLLSHLAWAQSAEKPDPAAWVPADALFYVGIVDIEQTIKEFQATNAYKVMKETKANAAGPSLGAVLSKATERVQEKLAKLLDTTPAQLKNPFRGRLAVFAVLPPGKTAFEDVGPALVAGVGDADTMRQYYDKIVKNLRDAAGSYESVSVGSHSIDVFTKKEGGGDNANENATEEQDEDLDPFSMGEAELGAFLDKELDKALTPENMPKSLATCLTSDRLIVAMNADQVRSVLRADGDNTLAGTEEHGKLLRSFESPGGIRMLVNIARLVEMVRRDPETSDDDRKAMDALGVDAFQALVAHSAFGGAPDVESRFEALTLIKGERTGLAKILSMPNAPVAPAPIVSGDTAMLFSMNLNAGELYQEIERIVRQIDPDTADQMRQSIEAVPNPNQEGQTINLRKELIENLREPIRFVLGFAQPYGVDSPRVLMTMGHRDQAAISKLLSLGGAMFSPRDVRGTQVYDFPFGGVSLATTSDTIVMGNGKAVESGLAGGDSGGLSADAEFQRTARHLPREASMVVYFDYRRFMDAALALLPHRSELEAAMMTNVGAAMAGGMVAAMFPNENAAEEIKNSARYAAPSMLVVETTSDGIKLSSVQLKPKE